MLVMHTSKHTKEKVAFVAGKEFGPLAGHTLLISKAPYGLQSSGARFHDKFADTLCDMGFKPSFCDPDVWYRDAGDCYEYVCTYVDDRTVYRRASATQLYRVHESARHVLGALIDGGANGCLLGSDARVLETHLTATANVEGVTHDVLENLPIVQAAAKLDTLDDGPVIAIFSLYALRNDGGRTIHCKGQMESFGLIVDDRAQSNGGTQCIVTTKGYVVPLHIREGLPYVDMTVPTDDDLDRYPHVFFTSDTPWDPSVLDQEFSVPDFDMPSTALARRDALDC